MGEEMKNLKLYQKMINENKALSLDYISPVPFFLNNLHTPHGIHHLFY